jgi:hypothetical protein
MAVAGDDRLGDERLRGHLKRVFKARTGATMSQWRNSH